MCVLSQFTGSLRRYDRARRAASAARPLRLVLEEELGGRPYEAGLVREHDRLHAVAELELPQHARDVRLDRRLAEEQTRRDLGVRQADRDELEHVAFALGERRER